LQFSLLRSQLLIFQRTGTTDIYVKQTGFLGSTDVFVEWKRNLLQKTQFDRLIGQIESLQPENAIIVILCANTNPPLATRLKEKCKLADGVLFLGPSMTIVLKEVRSEPR
jgi:hypothetical protein